MSLERACRLALAELEQVKQELELQKGITLKKDDQITGERSRADIYRDVAEERAKSVTALEKATASLQNVIVSLQTELTKEKKARKRAEILGWIKAVVAAILTAAITTRGR